MVSIKMMMMMMMEKEGRCKITFPDGSNNNNNFFFFIITKRKGLMNVNLLMNYSSSSNNNNKNLTRYPGKNNKPVKKRTKQKKKNENIYWGPNLWYDPIMMMTWFYQVNEVIHQYNSIVPIINLGRKNDQLLHLESTNSLFIHCENNLIFFVVIWTST